MPPKDFKFPDALKEVPINPKGPTEVPLKTAREYTPENVGREMQFLRGGKCRVLILW